MPVLVPLVPLGVALLALLVAYAAEVIVMPFINAAADEVPVVGGYIKRGARNVLDYGKRTIVRWVGTGLGMLAGWFGGLGDALRDFVDAVNAYLVELPDHLEHLLHVSVHEVVKAFLVPVHASLKALHDVVDPLPDGIDQVFTKPLRDFVGIEHGVRSRLDQLLADLRSIDLPNLLGDAEAAAGRQFDVVAGELHGTRDWAEGEFANVYDRLHAIPLQKLLDLLAASVGTFALVELIAREGGLENRDCRQKVKAICSTDPNAWQALLDVAGIALAFESLRLFLRLAQDMAREVVPEMLELAQRG